MLDGSRDRISRLATLFYISAKSLFLQSNVLTFARRSSFFTFPLNNPYCLPPFVFFSAVGTYRDVDGVSLKLRQLHRDALERIERIGLGQASRAAQRRSVLRLEYALDEGIVTPLVVF